MRPTKIIFSAVVLVLLCTVNSFAIGKKVAQSLMPFLELEVGPRQIAMGGAFITMSGDVSDIFWNPASVANMTGESVFFSHTNWIADIGYNAAAAGMNFGDLGTFTVSAFIMDYGTFYRTAVDPNPADWQGYIDEGTFTVSEFNIGIGYAKQISQQFSIGGQIKYAYQNLGTSSVYTFYGTAFQSESQSPNKTEALVFDFGTLYDFGYKGLRFAMTMQNFSNIQTPLSFKLGLGMNIANLWADSDPGYSVLVNIDALHPRDYSEELNFGTEFKYHDIISLRFGYKAVSDEQKMSYGIGISPKFGKTQFSVDYSYTPFGVFNNVQSFSVSMAF